MTVSPFALCIVAITILAALGLPIGPAMIASSIFYLLLTGADPGTVAEQILNGLFNSYVLLAIPLFILAADLMNIGSLTDRLLQFCLVLVGRASWSLRRAARGVAPELLVVGPSRVRRAELPVAATRPEPMAG